MRCRCRPGQGELQEKRGVQVRKVLTIGAIGMLLVAATALVAGCGSSQAKQYMQQADQYITQVDTLGATMSNKMPQMFSSVNNPAGFTAAVAEVKKTTAQITENANKARAEYEKIKGLKDAGGYADYADLQIAVIEIENQLTEMVNKFLDQATGIVNSPGGTPQQMTEAQNAFMQQVNEINAKLKTAQDAASKLRTEKGL
jgi:hypothetical protein